MIYYDMIYRFEDEALVIDSNWFLFSRNLLLRQTCFIMFPWPRWELEVPPSHHCICIKLMSVQHGTHVGEPSWCGPHQRLGGPRGTHRLFVRAEATNQYSLYVIFDQIQKSPFTISSFQNRRWTDDRVSNVCSQDCMTCLENPDTLGIELGKWCLLNYYVKVMGL